MTEQSMHVYGEGRGNLFTDMLNMRATLKSNSLLMVKCILKMGVQYKVFYNKVDAMRSVFVSL